MITAGSYLTIHVNGQVKGFLTFDDLAADVSATLGQVPLNVTSFKVESPNNIFTDILSGHWLHYLYQSALVVQTTQDYGDANDVVAIVTNAFYSATGIMPTSYSGVGAVDTAPPVLPPEPGMLDSITNGLSNLGSGVQSDFHWLIAGIVAILVIALVVIGFSAGPVARAVA